MRARGWIVVVVTLTLAVIVSTGDAEAASRTARTAGIIAVPSEAPTIQAAVNEAGPGTLILVAPGMYPAVTVPRAHHDIVIRGENRASTIVDCGFAADGDHLNGFKILADGVAIENLTARDCKSNGFLWQGVKGYRGSYLTAVRNGDYGIYAFGSTYGQWDHDFAEGSPDAGFYIGQCFPCHAAITDVESQWNGLGYSGTNSGGDLLIVRSSFHDNRAGIVPNSGSEESNPPERATTIAGNVVSANDNPQTAAIDIATIATGNGILLAGGNNNLVERNLVSQHDLSGIGVVPLPEQLISPGPKAQNFDARGNRVTGNVVRSNRYDLVLVSTINSPTDAGANCFSNNQHATSLPVDLEQVAPCTGRPTGSFHADLSTFAALLGAAKPPSADYQSVPLPTLPTLPNLPNARRAPARPATNEPSIHVSLASVRVPAGPVPGG
jgi:Right handed beta helix region